MVLIEEPNDEDVNFLKEIYDNFLNAMNEDFNTPVALVEFNKLVKIIAREIVNKNLDLIPQVNLMVEKLAGDILGLNLYVEKTEEKQSIPENITKLAELRWQAKLNKNWADADKFRNEITELGYIIIDTKDGYKIERK